MSLCSLNPDSCAITPNEPFVSSNYSNYGLANPGCDLSEAYHFQAEVLRTGWILGSLIAYQVRDSIGKGLLDNIWEYHPFLGSLQNSFKTLSKKVTRLAHCSSDPVFSAVQRGLSSLRQSLRKEEVPSDLRTQLGLDAVDLGAFSDTPLIVSDNGPNLPNVISVKEFEYLQQVYRAIEEGGSPLTIDAFGSPQFRKQILSDFRIILSTKIGRDLIYGLHKKNLAIAIEPGVRSAYIPHKNKSAKNNLELLDSDEGCLTFSSERRKVEIESLELNEHYYGDPDSDKVKAFSTKCSILFHELTHAYHDLVTGDFFIYLYDRLSNPWHNEEEKRTILKTNEFRRQLKMGEKDWYGRWGHIAHNSSSNIGRQLSQLVDFKLRIHDQLNTSDCQEVYNGQNIREFPYCPNINEHLERATTSRNMDWMAAILRSKKVEEIQPETLGHAFQKALSSNIPNEIFFNSKIFGKIPTAYLNKVMKGASLIGSDSIIESILKSKRADEISPQTYAEAFRSASNGNFSEITQMLVSRLSWLDTIKYYLGII